MVGCPFGLSIRDPIRHTVGLSVRDPVGDPIRHTVRDPVGGPVRHTVGLSIRDPVGHTVGRGGGLFGRLRGRRHVDAHRSRPNNPPPRPTV